MSVCLKKQKSEADHLNNNRFDIFKTDFKAAMLKAPILITVCLMCPKKLHKILMFGKEASSHCLRSLNEVTDTK